MACLGEKGIAVEHDNGVDLQKSVEGAAERLQVTVDEVWRMINTGDLSVQETASGQWTIPAWSMDYILASRSRKPRSDSKPRTMPPVACPSPEPQSKKKPKRVDPSKKWKRQFDELGRRKNELTRETRTLRRDADSRNRKRIVELEAELSQVLDKLEDHVKAGVSAGFVEPPQRRGEKQMAGKAPKLNLEQLGLQVGLTFSNEIEVLNTFDPRRKLETWEKPARARLGSFQRPDA